MTLKYVNIDRIKTRLQNRLLITDSITPSYNAIVQVSKDLVEFVAEEKENWVDIYLGMIYELPLKHTHQFLNSIVEKLVISDLYLYTFSTTGENPENPETFGAILGQQALNQFQTLFDGLGIFIPGATNQSQTKENDENRQQLSVKAIILPGEKIKPHIGYDYTGDNIADTDLFKLNTNVEPTFFMSNDYSDLNSENDIIDGIRVAPRKKSFNRNIAEIDFWN